MPPAQFTPGQPQVSDLVVLTGLTASASATPSPADTAASAMSQVDDELARAGISWADLRVLTVQLEGEVPGVASWRLMAERPA